MLNRYSKIKDRNFQRVPVAPVRPAELTALLLTKTSVRDIASKMGLVHSSAKYYIFLLCRRLGMHSRIEIMANEIVRLTLLIQQSDRIKLSCDCIVSSGI